MTFRKASAADHRLTVSATFSRAELVALFNAVLLDDMSEEGADFDRQKLLDKLAGLLDNSAPPRA